MRNAITPNRIANSILIKRKSIKKTIILEGTHDLLFFSKFKDEDCHIECALGWENVIAVINELIQEKFLNCIGVIDSDLVHIIPENHIIPSNVFKTDCHDLNIETIEYSFQVIYNQYYSIEKDNNFKTKNNIQNVKDYTYSIAKPLSFLRILSKRNNYNLCFKAKDENGTSLDYTKFICKDNYKLISIEKLVESVLNYSRARLKNEIPQKEIIVDELSELLLNEGNNYEHRELINGHDFAEIIIVGLKKVLGSNQHLKPDTILKECILNYEFNEFKKTNLFKSIQAFELLSGQEYLKN